MSSITGDALKNYYTFAYHIVQDQHLLNFTGMHYPFGEHIVYTDCQPALTFLLRCLPFTYDYVIGILHILIFLSFIVTPLFLYSTLRELNVSVLISFVFSLCIALLSPQFAKINHGHFGLAYGCVIPITILMVVRMGSWKLWRHAVYAGLFHALLFLMHPYLGFGSSLFSLLALLSLAVFAKEKPEKRRMLIFALLTGVLPVIFFKCFMFFTDTHTGRTTSPYGGDALVENVGSLLNPEFGPVQGFLENILPLRPVHFEGHSYLGITTIILFVLWLISFPFFYKKTKTNRVVIALLVPGVILLLFSFGCHLQALRFLGIESSAINQFRAVCRFAWYFYFVFPLFLIVSLHEKIQLIAGKIQHHAVRLFVFILLFVSVTEAHYYFILDKDVFWRSENVFNRAKVSESTKKIISAINRKKVQAILALPMFCNGSEMYDRIGKDASMIPAMICSFHTGLPIIGSWMSRTSIPETEATIGILNSYKDDNIALLKDQKDDIAVIVSSDDLLPDEGRLISNWKPDYILDSLKIGHLKVAEIRSRKISVSKILVSADSAIKTPELFYIPGGNNKPFITADLMDYEKITVLDSNVFKPGEYVLSLHYHLPVIDRQAIGNLIITRASGNEYSWIENYSLSELSGFYGGFNVFERSFKVERGCRYEFIIKGNFERTYRVSHFMLRPQDRTVVAVTNAADSLINNFPLHR